MRLQLPEGNQFFNLAGARAGFDQRFISAEEMMDIVRFAQIHQIEIIPSLDMPGHAR
jgi:N-acetyl-beta-hexosaminidase